MEASQVVDAPAGEEPIVSSDSTDHPGSLPESAYPEGAEPLPETPEAPELTPGSITLSTGQTDSVADISVVDEALTAAEPPVILELKNPQGATFKVRASEIIRYQ